MWDKGIGKIVFQMKLSAIFFLLFKFELSDETEYLFQVGSYGSLSWFSLWPVSQWLCDLVNSPIYLISSRNFLDKLFQISTLITNQGN